MGKQLHICHISILNPAIHSRIFFKMALAQVAAGYKVSIIAQDSASEPYERAGVTIIPIGTFGRLNWRRLWAARGISKKAKQLQADFYQIHAVELLGLAKKLKADMPTAKVIWDMHEDYVANILFADYYSEATRKHLARRVRNVQTEFVSWGDGLILAEDCFEGLIDFPTNRTAIVRNKFVEPASPIPNKVFPGNIPFMVSTGTIAENWGSFRAIELWKELNKIHAVGLVIAGHSQDEKVIARILDSVERSGMKDRFLLEGGNEYLPFEEIVGWIRACNFGLALYDPKENIRDRIPTKFYEFMAQQKPLLFSQNPAWGALNDRIGFGVSVEWPMSSEAVQQVHDNHLSHRPDPVAIPESEWSWASEQAAMLELLETLQ